MPELRKTDKDPAKKSEVSSTGGPLPSPFRALQRSEKSPILRKPLIEDTCRQTMKWDTLGMY